MAGGPAPEPAAWSIEPIARRHRRDSFDCGEPELDAFLQRFARQNEERRISRTYVAVRSGDDRVVGFFTVTAGRVEFEHLPDADRRGLPRYPVPVVHLGRLAVDRSQRGLGLGERLLVEALRVSLHVSEEVGAAAVEVVAKGEPARSFYARYGFRSLSDDPLHMFLPMADVRRAFASAADAGQ